MGWGASVKSDGPSLGHSLPSTRDLSPPAPAPAPAQPQLSCRIADSLSHRHRESHLAQTGHNSPSSQREPWSVPPAPKPALASSPLYSEPAPLQHSQGGWSQAPPWGEGRGAPGKDEAWRGAHRPRSQQGREAEPFPIMSHRGFRLSPGDPTWDSECDPSDPSV